MVFENVVVAYDGSDQALAAVKKAAEIVGGEEAAKLHVVFVTTHPTTRPLMKKPKRLRKALAIRSIPWAIRQPSR